MTASKATWPLLGQRVLMGRMEPPAPVALQTIGFGDYAALLVKAAAAPQALTSEEAAILAQPAIPDTLDASDGDPVDREQVLGTARALGRSLVVLAGDTPNAWASDLRDGSGNPVRVEFATASVSSPGLEAVLPTEQPAVLAAGLVQLIALLRYAETSLRGFLSLTVTAAECRGESCCVDTVKSKQYRTVAGASWRVAAVGLRSAGRCLADRVEAVGLRAAAREERTPAMRCTSSPSVRQRLNTPPARWSGFRRAALSAKRACWRAEAAWRAWSHGKIPGSSGSTATVSRSWLRACPSLPLRCSGSRPAGLRQGTPPPTAETAHAGRPPRADDGQRLRQPQRVSSSMGVERKSSMTAASRLSRSAPHTLEVIAMIRSPCPSAIARIWRVASAPSILVICRSIGITPKGSGDACRRQSRTATRSRVTAQTRVGDPV